jgi:two-component system sensor histidine kinase/response regulator
MTTRPSILIADDQPTNIGVLYDALEGSGYSVRIANNGEAALESARRAPPDLIVLDVMMPVLDGFETCRRLKSDPATRETPVIFMTARSSPTDEVLGLRLGAVDYITKPIQLETALARVKTHLTMRQLQRTLQHQNAELHAYARMVAHDLKNPLAAMISAAGFLELGADTLDTEKLKAYLEVILGAGQSAISTVDELLVVAGVRHTQPIFEPLDMATIVTRALARISHRIDTYRGTIALPAQWPVAHGHAPWIELVWTNYLSNGLKYGGEPPHLRLGAAQQPDGSVQFWVKDNGPGLTPEAQAQLFTEWTRLHRDQPDGHGLGLAIVRRIIERSGGSVGVESTIGEGSRFYFTLSSSARDVESEVVGPGGVEPGGLEHG